MLMAAIAAAMFPFEATRASNLAGAAGTYLCGIAKSRNKKTLAVFPFTGEKDEPTSASKRATTRVMSAVLGCGLRVLDKTKLKTVLKEQALGQSGLIDPDSAPKIGELIGADSLVFGTVDSTSVQVRLVDATTGEILGATVQEKSAKPPASTTTSRPAPKNEVKTVITGNVKITSVSGNTARKQFGRSQMKVWLKQVFRTRPALFLYVTSNENQIKRAMRRHGKRIRKIEADIAGWPAAQKEKLKKVKATVLELRAENPRFNRRVRRLQRKAFRRMRRGPRIR